MNAFRVPDHRLYNKYKRYWRIFLMPQENLNSWDYQPFKLFDWLTNTGSILDYLLEKNPLLKHIHNMLQNLREALQQKYSEVLKAQLAQSKIVKLPSRLRRVLRTASNLQRYIGNNNKYDHVANGRIDALNNKIK